MSINNNPQPQVRSSSLPTTQPQLRPQVRQSAPAQQPQAQAQQGAPVQEEQYQDAAAPAAEAPKKERKKYTRKKVQIDGQVQLSKPELEAWGRIAFKAMQQGISPEKYMQQVTEDVGAEIAVWNKLAIVPVQEAAPEHEQEQTAEA